GRDGKRTIGRVYGEEAPGRRLGRGHVEDHGRRIRRYTADAGHVTGDRFVLVDRARRYALRPRTSVQDARRRERVVARAARRSAVPADDVEDDVHLAIVVIDLHIAINANLHRHQVRNRLAGREVQVRCQWPRHSRWVDRQVATHRRLRHRCVDHYSRYIRGWHAAGASRYVHGDLGVVLQFPCGHALGTRAGVQDPVRGERMVVAETAIADIAEAVAVRVGLIKGREGRAVVRTGGADSAHWRSAIAYAVAIRVGCEDRGHALGELRGVAGGVGRRR